MTPLIVVRFHGPQPTISRACRTGSRSPGYHISTRGKFRCLRHPKAGAVRTYRRPSSPEVRRDGESDSEPTSDFFPVSKWPLKLFLFECGNPWVWQPLGVATHCLPPMPDQPPGDRAVILACSVRSLRQCCLDVQCGCGRSVHIPLVLMAANRQLAGLTMADVVV